MVVSRSVFKSTTRQGPKMPERLVANPSEARRSRILKYIKYIIIKYIKIYII